MSELNTGNLDGDDPELTAYALGELDGADAERYAGLIGQSVELQELVRQIQAEARMLSNELRLEPMLPVSPDRRAAIASQLLRESPTRSTMASVEGRRRPWLAWMPLAASAAAVAAVVAFSLPRPPRPQVAWSKSESKLADVAGVNAGTDPGKAASGQPQSATTALWDSSKGLDGAQVGSMGWTDESIASPGYAEGPKSEVTEARQSLSSKLGDRSLAYQADGEGQSEKQAYERGAVGESSRSRELADRKGGAPADKNVQSRLNMNVAGQSQFSVLESSKPVPFGDSQDDGSPQSKNGDALGLEKQNQGASSAAGHKTSEANFGNQGQRNGAAEPGFTTGTIDGVPHELSKKNIEQNVDRRKLASDSKGEQNGKPIAEPTQPLSGGDSKSLDDRLTDQYVRDQEGQRDLPKLLATSKYGKSEMAGESKEQSGGSEKAPAWPDVKLKTADSAEFRFKESQSEVESDRDYVVQFSVAGREKLRSHDIRAFDREHHEGFVEGSKSERQRRADPATGEAYQPIYENSFLSPRNEQLSTFSIDVDSGSYANMRRFLQSGQVPHPDAVRIEELVNYFSYQYPVPQDGKPFSVNSDIAACPWNPGHSLVRIGLKGREIPKEQRPPSSLVFLVDVSGSMSPENKLPLVRSSLKTLVGQLDERDRIAIVTYAGEAGVRLPSTSVAQKDIILSAIDGLGSGGSTNGAAGINTAYDIAAKEFIEKGINRVILCTDGDFNVGVTSDDALVQMIQTRARSGVFLSVFGFGMGNLKDGKLEQLADKGNGQYGYIDDRQESEKVFVQELSGTLVTIAKDVKIQVDFNPEVVNAYRLIGYENRALAAQDFHDDKKDAGEIGAGHTVTALYEIVPVADLKTDEKTRWMTVKLRYKQPDASTSELIENPLTGLPGQLKLAPTDFQFAASVASFGMLLRHSQHAGQANWSMVKELAQSGLSNDQYGHRAGFLRLVAEAERLVGERRPAAPSEPDSTVGGKYKSLLRRLSVPEDEQKYGPFREYGFDKSKTYGGADNLPEGYWVYVAPHWYIWGEATPDVRQ